MFIGYPFFERMLIRLSRTTRRSHAIYHCGQNNIAMFIDFEFYCLNVTYEWSMDICMDNKFENRLEINVLKSTLLYWNLNEFSFVFVLKFYSVSYVDAVYSTKETVNSPMKIHMIIFIFFCIIGENWIHEIRIIEQPNISDSSH